MYFSTSRSNTADATVSCRRFRFFLSVNAQHTVFMYTSNRYFRFITKFIHMFDNSKKTEKDGTCGYEPFFKASCKCCKKMRSKFSLYVIHGYLSNITFDSNMLKIDDKEFVVCDWIEWFILLVKVLFTYVPFSWIHFVCVTVCFTCVSFPFRIRGHR